MKYCPACGYRLEYESIKFCYDCGVNLSEFKSNNNNNIQKPFDEFISSTTDFRDNILESKDLIAESRQQQQEYTTIHNLGIKLEEAIESLFKHKGFSTQRRLKLKGRSGALHEIDVFANKKNQVIAIECKNYSTDRIVGIKEIRDFQSKLNDLHHNDDAIFVTFAKFSSDAITYANKYDIQLWDGDALGKKYLEILIGRSIVPTSTTDNENSNKIVLDKSLPISMTFEEVTTLSLQNQSLAKIKGALIFRPYYFADYKLDSLIVDRRGKTHRIRAEGKYVIDAITERILNQIEESKKDLDVLLSKRSKHEKEIEEELKKVEQNQIIADLICYEPIINYELQKSEDYSIEIESPQLSTTIVKNTILERIIEKNIKEIFYNVNKSNNKVETKSIIISPKKKDIVFRKLSLIYVPIWDIGIQSNTIKYRRRAFATSKTITLDEIALCPKDFSTIKIWGKKKSTYALCETCGISLCMDHIHKHNEKYYCHDHNK
jgi:hypothetical protein